MKSNILFFLILFVGHTALGFEETFQIEDDLPYWTILSQLANLGLLVGILFFTQRKNVAKAFAEKKQNFLDSVAAASRSQKQAEAKLKEVSDRLANMKVTFENQINEAKKNAEESYRIQVSDARNSAEKVKSMALNNIEFEVQKQVENLRVETFQKSAGIAKKNLEASMTAEQIKLWNSRFSSKQGAH